MTNRLSSFKWLWGLLLLLQINITALTNSLMTLLFAAGAVLSVLYLVLLHKTIRLVGRSDSEIMQTRGSA